MIAVMAGRLAVSGEVLPPKPFPAPKTEFTARLAGIPHVRLQPDDGLQLDAILEDVLPGGSHGDLLAYMIRRFGPPTVSTDSYKSLCAAWLLSTPMDDMFLRVEPSASGLGFSFSVLIPSVLSARFRALRDGVREEEWGRSSGGAEAFIKAVAPYTCALRTTLCDLLRPVWVRDHPINALGTVDDGDMLLAWNAGDGDGNGADEGAVHGVAYSRAATIGMPAGFFDDIEGLQALIAGLRMLDPDDYGAAMKKAEKVIAASMANAGPTPPDLAP
jgi:hypothetical protein